MASAAASPPPDRHDSRRSAGPRCCTAATMSSIRAAFELSSSRAPSTASMLTPSARARCSSAFTRRATSSTRSSDSKLSIASRSSLGSGSGSGSGSGKQPSSASPSSSSSSTSTTTSSLPRSPSSRATESTRDSKADSDDSVDPYSAYHMDVPKRRPSHPSASYPSVSFNGTIAFFFWNAYWHSIRQFVDSLYARLTPISTAALPSTAKAIVSTVEPFICSTSTHTKYPRLCSDPTTRRITP